MDLNIVWFLLIAVLLTGYAILDGFDLGVGVLHLFARTNEERRIHMNSIGPVWDGNEVWLLTGGGALFAAFPIVYANVFSGFYIALMLLLTGLIFRAVSFEFRGKVDSPGWRKAWDMAFGLGSFIPALLLGVAFGNILRGVNITPEKTPAISFLSLLNWYALLVGVFGLCVFVMHGAAYLLMKTEGDLHERMKGWINKAWILTVVLFVVTTPATVYVSPFLFEGILSKPLFWVLFLPLIAALVYTPIATGSKRYGRTFLATTVTIVCLMGLAALGLFPRLVPSLMGLEHSLTIYNASSSQNTLWTMLVIALIGMPLVITYTIYVYKVFKGKVVITKDSY